MSGHSIVGRAERIQRIELMKLGGKQSPIRKSGVVLRDECRGRRPAERVLDHLVVLAGAQEKSDCEVLVRLVHVSVEAFGIEIELAQVLGFEAVDRELDDHQAI